MTAPILLFAGFEHPEENWSKLPHSFIESLHLINSVAEIKLVLYILRHTWGYREYDAPKHITADEFVNGRKRKDGTRLDNGTGLSEPSVRSGLKKAIQHGFIDVAINDHDKARVEKSYMLKMSAAEGVKVLPPEGKEVTPRGQNINPRSEKETSEQKPKKVSSPKAKAVRPPDLEYNAISELWNTPASGIIVNIQGMLFGTKTVKGMWKRCELTPPTTIEELRTFATYARQRMPKDAQEKMPTAPVTIQRYFCDYRALKAKKANITVIEYEPVVSPMDMRERALAGEGETA